MRALLSIVQVAALIGLAAGPAQASILNPPDLNRSLPPPAIYAAYGVIAAIDPTTGVIERTGSQLPFIGTSAMLASLTKPGFTCSQRVALR